MSDNSLEVTEATVVTEATESETSEPVQDTKDSTEQDSIEPEEVVVESKEPEAVKDLTKYEKLEEKYRKLEHGSQKAIDRKTAATKRLEEQNRALQADVEKLRPTEVDNAPKEEDFDKYDDGYDRYQTAKAEHSAQQKFDALVLKDKEDKLAEVNRVQFEQAQKEFDVKETAFREITPDYDRHAKALTNMADDLVREYGSNHPTLGVLKDFIYEGADDAPAMIYKLGGNPEFVEDLVRMSPMKAAKELFKFEMSSSSTTTESKPLPTPIKPVKNASKASRKMSDLSGKDLMKRFNINT